MLRLVQNGEPKKVISSWTISWTGASLSEEIYMSYWRIYFMLGGVAPYLAKRVHDSTVRVAKWVMSFWFICYCLADLLGSYENYWHSRYIQWVLAFEVVVCGSIWGCILHLREFRMCGYLKPLKRFLCIILNDWDNLISILISL